MLSRKDGARSLSPPLPSPTPDWPSLPCNGLLSLKLSTGITSKGHEPGERKNACSCHAVILNRGPWTSVPRSSLLRRSTRGPAGVIGTSPLTQKESRLSGVIRWKYPHAPLGLGHASHVHLYHLRSLSYADGLSGLAFGFIQGRGKAKHSLDCSFNAMFRPRAVHTTFVDGNEGRRMRGWMRDEWAASI